MNTNQTDNPDAKESRRLFLRETGKKALWAAPVVTVIMTASSQRAKANDIPSAPPPPPPPP
jgi:hypothetical protein